MTGAVLHHRVDGDPVAQILVGAVGEHIRSPVGGIGARAAVSPALAEGVAENHGHLARFGFPEQPEVGAVDLPAHIGPVGRAVPGDLVDEPHGLHLRGHDRRSQRAPLDRPDHRLGCFLGRLALAAGYRDRDGLDLRIDSDPRQRDRRTGRRCLVGTFRFRFRRVPYLRARIAARIRGQRNLCHARVVVRRVGNRDRRQLRHPDRDIDARRQDRRGRRGRVGQPVDRVESRFPADIHRRRQPGQRSRLRGNSEDRGQCHTHGGSSVRYRSCAHLAPWNRCRRGTPVIL